ncbi:MAG: hypothetical protein AB7T06_24770 [Kofleriaceae bacterium]
MAVQTVPYALQNASHSAALFRQSASAPFTGGGALSNAELAVTQQASPNMSVLLGPGRAKVVGTSVSPPAGMSWTTQAMYDVLNDAPLTVTIAAANPTNPRIDLVYIQVRDAFYSGANNDAIAGVVTGTPAASPVVPATPANAVAVATVAVGAGVTTIVNANISRVVGRAALLGSGFVADLDALAALTNMGTGDIREVVELAAMFMYTGSAWVQISDAYFASAAARDTAYNKASAVYKVAGRANIFRTDTGYRQSWDGTGWRYQSGALIPVIPTSAVNATVGASGVVTFSSAASVSLNGCFNSQFDNYVIQIEITSKTANSSLIWRLRVGGVDASGATDYWTQLMAAAGGSVVGAGYATSFAYATANASADNALPFYLYSPAKAVVTRFQASGASYLGSSTTLQAEIVGGRHNVATAYDGITFIPASGAITGIIRVYGYNNN